MSNSNLPPPPKMELVPPRSRFSADEDQKILRLQQQNLDWSQISQQLGNRTARQCRERFQNYLDPELNTSNWTQDEDDLLILKESEMGKKWKKMMPYFKNRSNVNIKNRFATLQNRKKAADRAVQQQNSANNPNINTTPNVPQTNFPENSNSSQTISSPSSEFGPSSDTSSPQSPTEVDQTSQIIEDIFGDESDFSVKWNFLDSDFTGGNDFNSFFNNNNNMF